MELVTNQMAANVIVWVALVGISYIALRFAWGVFMNMIAEIVQVYIDRGDDGGGGEDLQVQIDLLNHRITAEMEQFHRFKEKFAMHDGEPITFNLGSPKKRGPGRPKKVQ